MAEFPQLSADHYPSVYIEDTDELLPRKVDQNLRYALFKTIARGGKCLVQSCKDLNLNRFICYKSLLPEYQDDPIEQQRFVREARVTAMLQHPNTVPTYDLGRNNQGRYYFTMKLVHGYTFREVLDYRERYDLTQMMDVMTQIAHALEYAHTHGVIHRDIKPENILVGPFGEVLLMDWGLAKVRSRAGESSELEAGAYKVEADPTITMHGKLEGTLCYMSPEQIKRNPDIDGRTDLFSLGAIIFEILTGRTPVESEGRTTDEVISETLNTPTPKPSSLSNLPIPKRLEKITLKCLNKAPEDRPASASELIRMLQEGW
jgi:serine/threonine protein kinase